MNRHTAKGFFNLKLMNINLAGEFDSFILSI